MSVTDVTRQVVEDGEVVADSGPLHDWKPMYWFVGTFGDRPPVLINRCERCKVYRDAGPGVRLTDSNMALDIRGGFKSGSFIENGQKSYEYTPHCSTTMPEEDDDD